MVSFASSYKCGFRLEVPAWYNVDTKEGEADDDTYLVPVAFYIGRRKPTASEV